MKAISKLAILIGFIVCISSCQKEEIQGPNGCSHQDNAVNQRVAGPSDTTTSIDPLFKGEEKLGPDEIVGGGDDDRDGGGDGGGKKGKRVR